MAQPQQHALGGEEGHLRIVGGTGPALMQRIVPDAAGAIAADDLLPGDEFHRIAQRIAHGAGEVLRRCEGLEAGASRGVADAPDADDRE